MKTIELKARAYQLIDNINDNNLLKIVITFISKLSGERKIDYWSQLTDDQRESIEAGLAQLKRGEGIPHAQVMNEAKTKYGMSK